MIPTVGPYPPVDAYDVPVTELTLGFLGVLVVLVLVAVSVRYLRRGGSSAGGGSDDE